MQHPRQRSRGAAPGRVATFTLRQRKCKAEQVTIANLRWLLGKATRMLGELRLADLSPKVVSRATLRLASSS
jgi:hypothetical protein